jgi:hypothetical protein
MLVSCALTHSSSRWRGAAAVVAAVWAVCVMGGLSNLNAAEELATESRTGIGDLICTLGDVQTETTPGLEGTAPREMICLFRDGGTGAEETYHGKLQILAESGVFKQKTLLWVVSIASNVKPTAGFLSQTYSSDIEASPDSVAPLVVGDAHNGISLKLMLERKKNDPQVRVGSVELTLAATGT